VETHLADWIKDTPDGAEADSILRACVHCGFCNATCPTYQVLGDELDGPRGRIYQIKQMLEGQPPGRSTLVHLDRCLSCMNCETTCPSGVRYGRLVEIGRRHAEMRVRRPVRERIARSLLRFVLLRRRVFDIAVRVGRLLRPALPGQWRGKLPRSRDAGAWPQRTHARKVLLLRGCVQPALLPAIDAATARVLDALGIEAVVAQGSGCCGAIEFHNSAEEGARASARRNIDAWWTHLEAGAEAIVVNASGCGAMIKDYARLLAGDAAYAEKAARISNAARDLAEFLAPHARQLAALRGRAAASRIAFHPPCTLQHTQKLRGAVEGLLVTLGAEVVPVADAHLCCGAAGTYALLQPKLSRELRRRKLDNLTRNAPQMILSANIGCLAHLEPHSEVPVRHWIEWVDAEIRSVADSGVDTSASRTPKAAAR